MSTLIDIFISNNISWFCLCLIIILSVLWLVPHFHDRYWETVLYVTTLWFIICGPLLSDFCNHVATREIRDIYCEADLLNTCPFAFLKGGSLNDYQITIDKNIAYPNDKVVLFVQSKHAFEVENNEGQARVVAVFKQGKEIDFP